MQSQTGQLRILTFVERELYHEYGTIVVTVEDVSRGGLLQVYPSGRDLIVLHDSAPCAVM